MGSISAWHVTVLLALLVFFGVPLAIIAFTPAAYRIRRKRYGLTLLASLFFVIFVQAMGQDAGVAADLAQRSDVPTYLLMLLLAILVWSLYLVRLTVGRAQDAGLSKWIVLLWYVPVVNLVLLVVLLATRSKELAAPPAATSTQGAGA